MYQSIPQSFIEITPLWLTSALRSSGLLDCHGVVACDVHPVGEEFGFASQVARIVLTYDSPDCNAPSSMIAKLAATGSNRELSNNLREKCVREAAFYSQIGTDAGIATPQCYYVACAEEGTRFVALLEDLSAARFGDVVAGCSMKEAELVVDSLAAFHGHWWNDTRLAELDWLPRFGEVSSRIERLGKRRELFLEQFGQFIPRQIEEMTLHLGPQHVQLLERVQGPPETLLHVDTHLDNVAFMGADDDIKFVLFDWQGVSKGLCVVDLALFLTSASTKKVALNDKLLLRRYFDGLVSQGIDDYPFDRLLLDYRIALLRWWIGTVNGLGSSHAQTWTGRQAEVAHQDVVIRSSAVLTHRVPELLNSQL